MRSLVLVVGAPLAAVEPLSDVSAAAQVDATVAAMNAFAKEGDWASATAAYEAPFSPADELLPASLQAMARAPLEHPLLAQYNAFYGEGFADAFVTAALDGTGPFDGWDAVSRRELLVKGLAYQAVHHNVLGLLEHGLAACKKEADGTRSWDAAWALYAGSLEGPDGTGKGALLHALAEKRCPQFGTCSLEDDQRVASELDTVVPKAQANEEVRAALLAGRAALGDLDCAAAAAARDLMLPQLLVPLLQGTLREAYETSDGAAGAHGAVEAAEGWAFLAAALPRLHACDAAAAAQVRANMDVANYPGMADGFAGVKQLIESTYACLGISCADVGGMRTCGGDGYCPGFEPCTDGAAGTEAGADAEADEESPAPSAAALLVLGALAA